jgi:hypothetical protein
MLAGVTSGATADVAHQVVTDILNGFRANEGPKGRLQAKLFHG